MDRDETIFKVGDVCLDCQQQGFEKHLRYFKLNLNGDTLLKCESNQCMYPYNDEISSTDEEEESVHSLTETNSLKFIDDFIQQYNNDTGEVQDTKNNDLHLNTNYINEQQATQFDITFLDNLDEIDNENLKKPDDSKEKVEFLDDKYDIKIIENKFLSGPIVSSSEFEKPITVVKKCSNKQDDYQKSFITYMDDCANDGKPKIEIQSIETIKAESSICKTISTENANKNSNSPNKKISKQISEESITKTFKLSPIVADMPTLNLPTVAVDCFKNLTSSGDTSLIKSFDISNDIKISYTISNSSSKLPTKIAAETTPKSLQVLPTTSKILPIISDMPILNSLTTSTNSYKNTKSSKVSSTEDTSPCEANTKSSEVSSTEDTSPCEATSFDIPKSSKISCTSSHTPPKISTDLFLKSCKFPRKTELKNLVINDKANDDTSSPESSLLDDIPKAKIMNGSDFLKKLAIINEKTLKHSVKFKGNKKKMENKIEIKNDKTPSSPCLNSDPVYSLDKISELILVNKKKIGIKRK